MDDFEKLLNKKLKEPEFKKLWDESEPEYQIAKGMLQSRIEAGMPQQQLSEKTGINHPTFLGLNVGMEILPWRH